MLETGSPFRNFRSTMTEMSGVEVSCPARKGADID